MTLVRVSAFQGRFVRVAASVGFALAAFSMAAAPAEAAKRRGKKIHAAGGYTPPYAAIVVDANTGRILHAQNEHAHRHPASVTKVMTLYMLFEQLEKGRYRLDSPLKVSSHGASMAPSKLGLRPGETIEVEDAIKALVTKSANDVAATVAENISGDEETFAEEMTRKARAIGMTRTTFRNASGLPNPAQVTTAYDLYVLGKAIQERFPKYYRYFATSTFYYGSAAYRNHNKLLGRVEGVDGIKTGYTNASGFNLLTSAKRDGRHIISVVLGGKSGASRDRIMANLVEENMDRGSTTRSATMVAEAPAPAPIRTAQIVEPARPAVDASANSGAMRDQAQKPAARPLPPVAIAEPVSLAPAAPAAASAYAPMKAKPAVVVAQAQDEEAVTTASVSRKAQDGSTNARIIGAPAAPVTASATTPSPLKWIAGPVGAPIRAAAKAAQPEPVKVASAAPVPVKMPVAARAEDNIPVKAKVAEKVAPKAEDKAARGKVDPKAAKAEAKAAEAKAAEVKPTPKSQIPQGGVTIQVGATEDVSKANALIAKAKGESRALASAKPFTEPVSKGGSTLYRARFALADDKSAEAACKQLKRAGMACFTAR